MADGKEAEVKVNLSTPSEEEVNEYVTTLVAAVAKKNAELMQNLLQSFFDTAITPIAHKLVALENSWAGVAPLIRQARRDRNATEAMKVMCQFVLEKSEDGGVRLRAEELAHIGMAAYEVANQMEVHALVSETQATSEAKKTREEVECQPRTDLASLKPSDRKN